MRRHQSSSTWATGRLIICDLTSPGSAQLAQLVNTFLDLLPNLAQRRQTFSKAPRIERALHLLNPTMSYFSVDGLVSGIKSHMIKAASKPTDAILRNVAAQSKFAAASPKSAVLSAAPSPDAVPTMP